MQDSEVNKASGVTMRERSLPDYAAEVCDRSEVRRGVPLPFGTREDAQGVNFALFSRHASRVRLEMALTV